MARKILIFSDGTGQRGVRRDGSSTNIHKMYKAAKKADPTKTDQRAFYDHGLGADGDSPVRDLLSKGTGLGISRNITECYNFILRCYEPGSQIGCFGFSRGAYTVRSVGGVLSTVGVPQADQSGLNIRTGSDRDDDQDVAKLRWQIAEQAVKTYQIADRNERETAAREFREKFACADAVPHAVGVFDTVESLGLPGITDVFNPFRHKFHDTTLSHRTPFGFHALSIDENRRSFQPVLWDETSRPDEQVIEQRWFPGVHSDIGGGYVETGLSDTALQWMIDQCSAARVGFQFDTTEVDIVPNIATGQQHNERTGFGFFWLPKHRGDYIRWRATDDSWLCDDLELRYQQQQPAYRPDVLRNHPRVENFY